MEANIKSKKQGRIKKVKTIHGLIGWQCRLQKNYKDFEEFSNCCSIYDIANRLGFNNHVEAWNLNPIIQSSINPLDFTTLAARIVKSWDNFGTDKETVDRYTVINIKTGDGVGSSEMPFHPCGVGSRFNLVDNIMFHKYGASWRKRCRVKAIINEEVSNYISEAKSESLGKEVEYVNLPYDVKKFLHQDFEI